MSGDLFSDNRMPLHSLLAKIRHMDPVAAQKRSLSGFLDQTLHNHDIYVFHSKVELASTHEVVAKRAALTSWSALMKNKYKRKFIALALYLLFHKCTTLKYI